MSGQQSDTNIVHFQIPILPGSALCAQVDPDLWFPDKGASLVDVQKARNVCQACPVRDACLEWALATNERNGIWAGTTAYQRRAIIKQRAAEAG